jgi:hypothetical protein
MKNRSIKIGRNLPSGIVRKYLFPAFIFISFSSLSWATPFEHLLNKEERPIKSVSKKAILANSQISYRAEGGFSGVESYGVIISCVKGKMSVMMSIYDPRLHEDNSRVRRLGSMDSGEYLNLWDNLQRQALFKLQDSPPLTMDITDEFTNHFFVKVQDKHHQFNVVGISRPESSRYYAIRQLIDQSVNMRSLWDIHHNLARHLEEPSLTLKP